MIFSVPLNNPVTEFSTCLATTLNVCLCLYVFHDERLCSLELRLWLRHMSLNRLLNYPLISRRRRNRSSFLRRATDAQEATSLRLLRFLIIHNCSLKYVWGNLRVAHRAFLRVLLLRAFEPVHEALVVEDVPTSWNLSHLTLIVESFHADDAFWCVKLIKLFVVLAVLGERDEFHVALYRSLMLHSADRFLLLLPASSQFAQLLCEPVPVLAFSLGAPIVASHSSIVFIFDASACAALQAHHNCAAGDT